MHIATISSKNQITLPVDFMKKMGLKPGNKIIIEKKKDKITVQPVPTSIINQLAGSLNKYVAPEKLGKSWEAIKEESDKEYTKYLAKKYHVKD